MKLLIYIYFIGLFQISCKTDNKKNNESEKKYKASIDKKKVPIYGTLRVQTKETCTVRFFSSNVNGMSFWKHNNYKAQRLKFIYEKYKIDAMGLQEVCINWMNF